MPGPRWSAQAHCRLEFQIKHLTQRRAANGRQWKQITQRRLAARKDPNWAQTHPLLGSESAKTKEGDECKDNQCKGEN